jgi:NAD(P)-dependent dehydrogenase (short-subunit alcohol dehydrogenase family)
MNALLNGRSVVVIGASSGIGRGVAVRSVRAGAEVVLAARRADRLDAVVTEAGGGTPIPTDLCIEGDRLRLAERVGVCLHPVDLVVVSAGTAPLGRMAAVSHQDWLRVLETNLIGIHQTVSSLLEHLSPRAVIAVVSSEVVSSPRSHLGAYGASKAALEHSFQQWQEEHPWLRFTTISLGATVPTEFGHDFSNKEIVEALGIWAESGQSQSAFMDTEQVCDVLVATLASLVANPTIGVPRIELRSPAPVVAHADRAIGTATASRTS